MIFDRTNTIMAIKNDPEMASVVIQQDSVDFASHLADVARITKAVVTDMEAAIPGSRVTVTPVMAD